MHTINVLNINDAYASGRAFLSANGERRQSRNGAVLVVPEPVTTHYRHPTHRVLFDEHRDANPFFHLGEALWMLAGSKFVDPIVYLLPKFAEYSDDGATFHGAYGYRWRKHFGFDQLSVIVEELHVDPNNRRVMLQMWSAMDDLGHKGKDLPCNTMAKFWLDASHERLNMAVFCRSNDIIWGCYGANAVHFSMLQEYIASRLGIQVGFYEQISCDYHAYEEVWNKYDVDGDRRNPYVEIGERHVTTVPLMQDPVSWDYECRQLVDALDQANIFATGPQFQNPFFNRVAVPMFSAFRAYRKDHLTAAIDILGHAIAEEGPVDWLVNGKEWMERRERRRSRR